MDAAREEPDLALVESVTRGVPGAYERLLERTRRIVDSCLSAVVARSPWLKEDTADLRQGFQLTLIEHDFRVLRSFQGRSSLTTWIHVIATRFFHRQAGALKARRTPPVDPPSETSDPSESPEMQEMRRRDQLRVREAVSALSTDDRLFLALLYEEELQAPEVGRALGISASGVRMKKQRLLQKLTKILGGLG